MNGKPTKNIDDIFRDSIENIETEPSESFWLRASEDSLYKGNLANGNELNKWKVIAYSLGAAVVLLALFLIFSLKENSALKQQVTQTKQANSIKTVLQGKEASNAIAANSATKRQTTDIVSVTNEPSQVSNNQKIQLGSNPVAVIKKNVQPASAKARNGTSPGSSTSATTTNANSPAVTSQEGNNVDNKSVINNAQQVVAEKTMVKETIPVGDVKPDNGNVQLAENNSQVPLQSKKPFASRLSVALFYAPYISDELLESDGSDNVSVTNNITAAEEEVNPYVIGVRAGYDISPKLTVTTGIYYYDFLVQVSPVTIYASQQANGSIGYSFQTSMGMVDCNYDGKACIGDKMIISGMATAHYISVPIQFKYVFSNTNRLSFYLAAGTALNIVAYRKMDMHWRDFNLVQGNELEGIQNSDNMYLSFYAAPGLNYRFYKGFSLYAEPALLGSPTFFGGSGVNKNSPLFVSLGGGLSYHF